MKKRRWRARIMVGRQFIFWHADLWLKDGKLHYRKSFTPPLAFILVMACLWLVGAFFIPDDSMNRETMYLSIVLSFSFYLFHVLPIPLRIKNVITYEAELKVKCEYRGFGDNYIDISFRSKRDYFDFLPEIRHHSKINQKQKPS